MNLLPTCFLYTQDASIKQMVEGYLMFMAVVRHVDDPSTMEAMAMQFRPALIIVDLRGEGCGHMLPALLHGETRSIVIALGAPRSNPALEADASGVYAVEILSPERQRFQSIIRSAQAHQKLLQENLMLKSAAGREALEQRGVEPLGSVRVDSSVSSFRHLSGAFRHFDNVDNMIDRMVEEIACSARVARAGIFLADDADGSFTFKGGVKCLSGIRSHVITSSDPLIHWLRLNAHFISRATLGCLGDLQEKLLLKHSLDWLGAEALVPLHGRERVIGFLFVGRRISGNPFGQLDVEELTLLADHLAIAIEHSLLYERTASQESMMNTVFDSMQAGVVTMKNNREIGLMNNPTRTIFDIPVNLPLEDAAAKLDNRVKDLLIRASCGEDIKQPGEWIDPLTKRSVSVSVKRLEKNGACTGSVALIHDTTAELRLREHEGFIERAAFWAALANAVSHEVRNPLVAISTFSQLLPERYDDPDFRAQFSGLVAREVERLNSLVKQLDDFANPAAPEFKESELKEILSAAKEKAVKQFPDKHARLELTVAEGVPAIECSTPALIDCFCHIIINALEATNGSTDSVVSVKASSAAVNHTGRQVIIQFEDNGKGIPKELTGDLFSPFVTSKARGLGLGLTIARRTVSDHHGEIDVKSSPKGTCVTVKLPRTVAERRTA